jgi:translation initiation factor IF-2
MNKVRVYEVARELGLNNRDLLNRVQSLGIQVRNHMSALEPSDIERIRRSLDKEKGDNTVEERIRKTVIRRRTVGRRDGEDIPATSVDEPRSPPRVEESSPVRREGAHAVFRAAEREETVAPAASAVPRVEASDVTSARESLDERVEARPSAPSDAGVVRVARVEAGAAELGPDEEGRDDGARGGARAIDLAEAVTSEAPSTRALAPVGYDLRRPSQPPPAAERLAHAILPPGVISRGNQTAPSAGQISEAARNRIISEHAQQRPRRVEVGRRELGQPGRPAATTRRPGRKVAPLNKKGAKTEITVPSAQKRIIRIEDNVGLQGLAQRMSLKATDVLMKLMQLGMTNVTINSTLDSDTAKIIASEFGYEVENVAKSEDELIGEMRGEFQDKDEDRALRPPVVTVMGHVDHGKTSLLDRIRKANVAAGEAGGITQHIGAYRVNTSKGTIVFLDTPGHEAFTAMRARGAQATDLVVLVVAADDGVMPQTKEAINHAKAANVPIVVAVNKIDKHGAQPLQIRNELVGYGLQPEEWGGNTLFVDVSAVTGQGVDQLLDSIALQAEILELSANPTIPAVGVVLEAYLDRGRGPVANILVRNGTLNQGDTVVAGAAMGKVRALTDENGQRLKSAGPATPVEVLGLAEVPSAGDGFYVVENEERARELVDQRQKSAAAKAKTVAMTGLEKLQTMLKAGEQEELNLVIKSDVHGSVEALTKALTDLSTEKVRVNVIHTGVGGITENDVMLATASKAIIIGFNVRPAGKAGATAKSEGVEIRTYRVIYEAVDDVKKAMAGLLAPELREKELGRAEVRQAFSIPKIGTIAGCYVTEGKIQRNAKLRLVRDSVQIWEGSVGSLRRFKDDVREVASGYECGIGLEGYNDVKEGDVIECYELEKVAASL